MSNTDDLFYLSPSFDPSSLTVPRLRSLLVAHDVAYPSSAKKAQLVQLFQKNISSKANSIKAAHTMTKRSQRGIEDVLVSQDKSDSKGGKPIPSVKAITLSNAEEGSDNQSTVRGSDHSSTIDQGSSNRSSSKKLSRFMHVQPRKSLDEATGESPFSDENPFQTNVSPLAHNLLSEKRRKTENAFGCEDRRKSGGVRRKTTGFSTNSREIKKSIPLTAQVPSSYKIPKVSQWKASVPPPKTLTGEDSASEPNVEEMQDRMRNSSPHHVSVTKRQVQSFKLLQLAPLSITIVILLGIGLFWRQEKLHLGYCGVRTLSKAPRKLQVPGWANFLEPTCEPCPQHAFCYPNLQTVCEKGFVRVPHPLSIFGVIPLPPTCEPDTDAAVKIRRVADKAVEHLRERNAEWECGTTYDEQGRKMSSAAICEDELKEAVSKKKRKVVSQTEFEDMWREALGDIMGREETVSTHDQ